MTSTQYSGNIVIVAVDGFCRMTSTHVDLTKQEGKQQEHHAQLPRDISAYQNAIISLIRSVNMAALMSRTNDPLCNKVPLSFCFSCFLSFAA